MGGYVGAPFHRRPQGDRHGRPVRTWHARRACARHRGPHGRPRADRRGSRAPPRRSDRHHGGMDAQADGRRALATGDAGGRVARLDRCGARRSRYRSWSVMWEKADLGGLPTDSVRLVEGSLLVEAARPGLLVILDPVTGAVLFDSRRPGLTQIVTRRVLPQSGTLLVHGRRANGPAVVALYDLVTGEQRWVNEGLFEQTEPKKKGLGGLMQGLVRAASEATALEVLQAGPDMIVVHTLMGLRALDARSGAVRWSATLPTARAGNPARHVRLFPSLDKTDRL